MMIVVTVDICGFSDEKTKSTSPFARMFKPTLKPKDMDDVQHEHKLEFSGKFVSAMMCLSISSQNVLTGSLAD